MLTGHSTKPTLPPNPHSCPWDVCPSACTCSCETAVVSLRWWNSVAAHSAMGADCASLLCCFLFGRESEAKARGSRTAMQRAREGIDLRMSGWLVGWAPPARTPLGLNRLRVRRSWMNGSALLSTSPTWGAAPVRRWPPNIQPTPTPAALSSWPFKLVNIYPRACLHWCSLNEWLLPSPTLTITNFIAFGPFQAQRLNSRSNELCIDMIAKSLLAFNLFRLACLLWVV